MSRITITAGLFIVTAHRLFADPSDAFLAAVVAGDVNGIQAEIEKGADVNGTDEEGRTPLFYVVQAGDLKVATMLIQRGARVNVMTASGETPLTEAVAGSSIELVQVLLKSGANPNEADPSGTVLHVAIERGLLSIADF